MSPFDCRHLTRAELEAQLAEGDISASTAVADATLYTVRLRGRECLLLALPGGEGLRIDLAKPPARRRRADPGKPKTTA